MIPEVGATCAFTFTTPFSTLNGIYRIRAETTFTDAIASGVDFIASLYTPAGLAQANFNSDYPSYLQDRVAVLQSVSDTTIVRYTPESIFLTIPDPTVKEYLPLILVVNLGVQANTQIVLPLMDQITDLIQANLGTSDSLRLLTNPQNKVYLTDNEYTILEQARAANITKLMPLSVQLKQLQDQNLALAAKIAAYEALLAQAATT